MARQSNGYVFVAPIRRFGVKDCVADKNGTQRAGQSVPLPLRATMLKLLRLSLFHSLRVENSRNPGLWPAHADFSDALHPLRVALACFTSRRFPTEAPFGCRRVPRQRKMIHDQVVTGDINARYDQDNEH